MITSLAISQIFVLDQDQALQFYVDKLGLEVSNDVDLGFMRWLTVRVPGEDREILLERPGPPGYDPDTADAVREMVTKPSSWANSAMSTAPDQSSRCLISNQLRPSPYDGPFVRISAQEPFSLKPLSVNLRSPFFSAASMSTSGVHVPRSHSMTMPAP